LPFSNFCTKGLWEEFLVDGERSFTAATPGIAKIELAGQIFYDRTVRFHPNSLAGFLLVGLILTLPILWQRSNRLAISYLLLTVSAIALAFSRPVWLVVGLLPLFFLGGLAPESFTRREELAQTAIQLIKQTPFLGVGLNNFLFRLPFTNFVQPVHNIYLLIASETGIIIFITFIIFIIKP
jgi:O-antigen ligase